MSALRKKFAIVVFMATAICLPAFAAKRETPTAADIHFESLPLERSAQNHLLVRAFINGKPAVLGVDTGAPVSAVAMNRRKHFGVIPIGVNSKIPARLSINGSLNSVVIVRSLRIGILNLIDEPMVAVDLGGSGKNSKARRRAFNEPDLDGILGADILFPTKAVLDYEKQVLVLKMDPEIAGNVPGYDYRSFHGVPMHVSDGYNLFVDSTVNGRKTKLMVDTGAFATLLHSRFMRQMRIPTRKTRYQSEGVNLRQRGVSVATVTRFSVGSLDLKKNEVGVINLEGLIHDSLLDATPPVAGLLGSEMLRRYHGIIDFGTSTLYLKR